MKKNRIQIIILISCVFILSSCLSSNSFEKETKKFKRYLTNQFSEPIKNNIYILIPMNLCGSCVDKISEYLQEKCNSNNKDYIIIISDYTSKTFFEVKDSLKCFNILEDSKHKLIKDDVISGKNIVLFKVENEIIVDLIEFNPNINDSNVKLFLKSNNL